MRPEVFALFEFLSLFLNTFFKKRIQLHAVTRNYIVITAVDILSFPLFQSRIKVGSVPVFRHRLRNYIVFTFDFSRRFVMASLS